MAASCSGAAATDMPPWRWEDPPVPHPEEIPDPHPAISARGWTNVSPEFPELPEGVSVYKSPSQWEGLKLIAYVAVADLKQFTWDVASIDDPALKGTEEALKTPSQFFEETAAPVILNGGYFYVDGGKRYNASVAVSGGLFYGVNINYASKDWVTMYYPTRGVFHETDGRLETGWTYWNGTRHYLYGLPAPNSWEALPLPVPDSGFPAESKDFAPRTAIGGGPVLLKDGAIINSWKAELFYSAGADDKMPGERHPRSAIGYAPEGLLVLFACEGRGMTEGVAGMTFDEVARVMKSLGCTEALNLDGGGSSCLLIQGKETIKVSDNRQRPVSSVVILKKR